MNKRIDLLNKISSNCKVKEAISIYTTFIIGLGCTFILLAFKPACMRNWNQRHWFKPGFRSILRVGGCKALFFIILINHVNYFTCFFKIFLLPMFSLLEAELFSNLVSKLLTIAKQELYKKSFTFFSWPRYLSNYQIYLIGTLELFSRSKIFIGFIL